jgi:hypothetical protein
VFDPVLFDQVLERHLIFWHYIEPKQVGKVTVIEIECAVLIKILLVRVHGSEYAVSMNFSKIIMGWGLVGLEVAFVAFLYRFESLDFVCDIELVTGKFDDFGAVSEFASGYVFNIKDPALLSLVYWLADLVFVQ